MAKKKRATHAPEESPPTPAESMEMQGEGRSYPYRGRTIEVLRPTRDATLPHGEGVLHGKLRIDGRSVDYEQNDEGVYSHEMMYMRFSTPEELAEELVRQWGTTIPKPMDMHTQHQHGTTTPDPNTKGPRNPHRHG